MESTSDIASVAEPATAMARRVGVRFLPRSFKVRGVISWRIQMSAD
jgi:hypothetical protein